MDTFKHLMRRDDEEYEEGELTPTMAGLLMALLCLVLLGLACIGALLVLRRMRQRRMAGSGLPTYETSPSMTHLNAGSDVGSRRGHRRTLTITSTPYSAPTVSYHDQEKAEFLNEKGGPGSPVPEIHITFPEEHGDKRGSRVVVVKITDNGNVGLEPYQEKDQLPRYEKEEGKRDEWRSLDLEKMGGLREKDEKRWG